MNATKPLTYQDFCWRVSQIAEEKKVWSQDAAISLPAICSYSSPKRPVGRGFLSFLYRIEGGDPSPNPQIANPYALVLLSPQGDVIRWEQLSEAGPSGVVRFQGAANRMSPIERQTFINLYYLRLTCEEGPLNSSWTQVSAAVRDDLNKLFFSFVEQPFLPLYHEYAPDFLSFLEMDYQHQPH